MQHPQSRTLLLAAALALGACIPRGAAVESEPGPIYTVEVRNPMPHAMIVSYDDGGGERLLGTVEADGTQAFVITAPAQRTVNVIARDRDRTHQVVKPITLRPGEVVHVTLSP